MIRPLVLLAAGLISVQTWSESVIPLWPEGVPDAKPNGGEEWLEDGRVRNVHNPTLTYYPPTGANSGTAMIVCPGGGYTRLALTAEAAGITPRLTALGIGVFVLKYRLGEYGFPAPLQDILRAVRLLRSRATEFGLKPDRIGIYGASAGGHVAAMAATMYDAPEGRTGASLDTMSGRPDFVALQYPVITMKPPFVHTGSRTNLLGEHPTDAMVERLSLETQVTSSTPPVFIMHTLEDTSVPIENSYRFVDALRNAGVPVEAHYYERGLHGFGVAANLGTTSTWPDRLADWLHAHGWTLP